MQDREVIFIVCIDRPEATLHNVINDIYVKIL